LSLIPLYLFLYNPTPALQQYFIIYSIYKMPPRKSNASAAAEEELPAPKSASKEPKDDTLSVEVIRAYTIYHTYL
jgi:hypothetical protein